ncbi:type I polyketide synthase [Saccharothrix sp. NRRL B-16314]|uniref:type I polyketide synthase n=1 Tax=Saccharothrix sp. NRRL B-16314 TaxID=1463825 RepID=UPI000691AF26|nr:type I polyketide synthase [Saccharothrix sp. NRRL B-16314]
MTARRWSCSSGDDVGYIEAHGTATELGDPIEVAALTRAFGETAAKQFVPIGSAKTNVGHLDRAAGVTGLIKTSLALWNGVIPPSLHYTEPNPQIDFENSPFYVNTELSPWRDNAGKPPVAGINSLGMGGTNVHVVVEQAPQRPAPRPTDPGTTRRHHVLPISARNVTAADQAGARLAEHLASKPDTRLVDVAYTLQVGRKTFEHRRALVASSVEQAAAALGGDRSGVLGRVDTTTNRQVAFLFTGVGEQYPGMVAELYQREPVFRAELDRCLAELELPDVDLTDLLTGERAGGNDLAALLGRSAGDTDPRVSALERTEVVQPALFAVEYALARTLMTWGLKPRVMLGYSLGEYVAACLAGVLSVQDALKLVAHRAKAINALPGGTMVAVSLSVEGLRRYRLDERGLDVAAVNGPEVTVLAGPQDAMDALVAELRKAEVPNRALQTTHAFHSRMLESIADDLTAWVKANVTLNAPTIPYISNVTGARVTVEQATNPAYWARHMCRTVQFSTGVDTLLADEEVTIVEIGPGQSLGAMLRTAGCPPERWPLILSTLPPAGDRRADDEALADCLARLWLTGVRVDWTTYHRRHADAEGVDPATLPNRVPLPTYAFQRQDYWIEPPVRGAVTPAGQSPAEATLDVLADLPKLPEEEWLHLPVWRQTAAVAAGEQPASWLVFTREGVADDVVAELRRTGAAVTEVRPGAAYEVVDGGHVLRPGNVDDSLRLLRDLRAAGTPLDRVVHLWTLGDQGDTAVRLGLHTLVALARAAGELGVEDWSLDVVGAGTQQVLPGDVADPHAATLVGPSLVIPLEYPTVTARFIDVDASPTRRAVTGLVGELGRPLNDRIVALRHGRRWVPGYESMPSTVDTSVLRDGGVYLITGGLGGIGLAMAEELAKAVKAKLVLFGRTGLPEPGTDAPDEKTRQRAAQVAALAELGAEVEVVTGDVSDPADVRRAVDTALARFGALNGVLHAAGVPGMGLMQFKQPHELDQVLAPKVAGTLALAEALRIGEPDEVDLDFWVLFSSITSATGGGPGQVDYTAANAFLDAYAQQLAAGGRNVVSVDWGEWTWNAWSDGLSGYSDTLQEFLVVNRARIGIGFAEGWRSLLRALATGEPRVVVSTQDFDTMVRFSSQFTLAAVTSSALAEGGGARHPRPELVTLFQEPSGATEESIAAVWCESLRLAQVGVLDNFFELGGNSLLGVNIVASLRREFGLAELPPHILYEAPTVASLAKVVEAAAGGGSTDGPAEQGGQLRAQLRRSGVAASAARRRGK